LEARHRKYYEEGYLPIGRELQYIDRSLYDRAY